MLKLDLSAKTAASAVNVTNPSRIRIFMDVNYKRHSIDAVNMMKTIISGYHFQILSIELRL